MLLRTIIGTDPLRLQVMMSDALLLYAPSQVALAALLAAARKAANEATLLAYLRVLLANHTTPECTGGTCILDVASLSTV